MASLEYVTAWWLRSRRLTVASVGAGRGCGGLCPWPLLRQGEGPVPGDILPGGGRLGRRGGGRPWLHSGGSSPVYLVPLWALFSPVRSQIGWALLSSRVWPSGLSGALLPWSSSFWRCQITRICGPRCPQARGGGTGLYPQTRSSRPCGRCGRAAGPSHLFRILGTPRVGAVLVAGGRMMRMPGPGGVVVMIGGRMTRMPGPGLPAGSGGLRGVGRLLLSPLGTGRVRPFSVSLAWRWWGWGGVRLEEGVRSLLARIP